jgi:hypothetical protein
MWVQPCRVIQIDGHLILSGAWHFQHRMPGGSEYIDCIMTNRVRPTDEGVDG